MSWLLERLGEAVVEGQGGIDEVADTVCCPEERGLVETIEGLIEDSVVARRTYRRNLLSTAEGLLRGVGEYDRVSDCDLLEAGVFEGVAAELPRWNRSGADMIGVADSAWRALGRLRLQLELTRHVVSVQSAPTVGGCDAVQQLVQPECEGWSIECSVVESRSRVHLVYRAPEVSGTVWDTEMSVPLDYWLD